MIISIAGKAGNGKTTTANMIKELLGNDWEIKSWGTKVKKIASILTGIPVEKFNDHDFKKTYLPEFGVTVRELLQKIGTDAIRDNVHPDSWVIALMKGYELIPDPSIRVKDSPLHSVTEIFDKVKPAWHIYPNWIIDDTRFSNEYDTIKDHDGINIRVHKTHPDTVLYEVVDHKREYEPYPMSSFEMTVIDHLGNLIPKEGYNAHESDTSLDNHSFDYEIYASNTEELLIEVKKMLQYFKLNK